jgi:hypothetical protein
MDSSYIKAIQEDTEKLKRVLGYVDAMRDVTLKLQSMGVLKVDKCVMNHPWRVN